jgi:cysteine desulfurase
MHYFDNNATTRVAPEVLEAMWPYLTEHWGNASSVYAFGRTLREPIEEARARVAALIGADPAGVVFTSGGTESINSALNSALAASPGRRHIVTTAVEHAAGLKCCEALLERGYEITFLPVAADGALDLDLLDRSLRPDTALVSIMWANNETGVIFPVSQIGALCRSRGVLFHSDAVQAAGKVRVDVDAAGVDYLSLSGHKLNAPKGIGLLYVRKGVRFHPYLCGGAQEAGRRGGTENVPYIVGFGRAAELARSNLSERARCIQRLRDRMEAGLLGSIPDSWRNGAAEPRLPNTSNVGFGGIEGEAVLLMLDRLGICASSGSACTTGSLAPSHVLTAMGSSPTKARGSIRFSLGADTTEADVDFLLEQLPGVIQRLRATLPRTEG